jgi:hypothetical protein
MTAALSTNLSATQTQVLQHAALTTEGRLLWFPENLKGGAKAKVLGSLSKRDLITSQGPDWFIATAGYAALGLSRRAPVTLAALDAVIANANANEQAAAEPTQRTPSKQAQVLALLQRDEGATLQQMCALTNWQAHTMRGALAGSFKKKLGLVITSSKDAGGERIYRLAPTGAPA